MREEEEGERSRWVIMSIFERRSALETGFIKIGCSFVLLPLLDYLAGVCD